MYVYCGISLPTEPLRLTFPVRGGVILEPFQLEHGKVISHKVFILKESFHKMLVSRYIIPYCSIPPQTPPTHYAFVIFYNVILLAIEMTWSCSSLAIYTTTSKKYATGQTECQLASMKRNFILIGLVGFAL